MPTPISSSRYTTLSGPTELRNDPYYAMQRGAQAGLLADIPGAIPDLLNIGSDYFYSGLNSLLDVGGLSPYDIPRSLGIHPSQRQPIGPTSVQLEQSLEGAGVLGPTTGTTTETLSRVGAGFAEGGGPAIAGALRKSPAFFSGLLSAAKTLPKKGTTQQMTKGLLSGGGKEAEIKATGLDEWMKKPSPVDEDMAYRENIVEYLEDNQVELQETIKRGSETQFSSHVEPGGDNYKEMVLSLPDQGFKAQAEQKFRNHMEKLLSDKVPRNAANSSEADYAQFIEGTVEQMLTLSRAGRTVPSMRISYDARLQRDMDRFGLSQQEKDIAETMLKDVQSAGARDTLGYHYGGSPNLRRADEPLLHWDEDNTVVHIRFNDRETPDGDDILFLEEIQSDWANLGLKRGFGGTRQELADSVIADAVKGGMSKEQATKDVETLLQRGAVADERLTRIPQLSNYSVGGASQPHTRLMDALRDQVDTPAVSLDYLFQTTRDIPMTGKVRAPNTVPDAPFVKNPNQWARLALGRMLRYAADKGYDKLAWTTGRTQAARWGELEKIKRIEYRKIDPSRELASTPHGGYLINTYGDGNFRRSTEQMTTEMIKKKFGQDVLDRIEAAGGAHMQAKSIDVDLEIGGDKKKQLYDQVYVNVMKKLVKKLGGTVKRETVGANKLEAWTVTIPRGWKRKVKEGLPLFSVPAAGLLGAEAYQSESP